MEIHKPRTTIEDLEWSATSLVNDFFWMLCSTSNDEQRIVIVDDAEFGIEIVCIHPLTRIGTTVRIALSGRGVSNGSLLF